jgi:osmotically-inducible protein OsmY
MDIKMKTDLQLQRDVLAELAWEPSVNAAHIGVEANAGIVTLEGHVDSYAEKWDAERAAQRVSGVKALAVEIDIKLPKAFKRTDQDIAQAAQNALEWTTTLPPNSIKVMVEKGWITLKGETDWEYQRESAKSAVRYLMGVTGVSDQIALRSKVTSSTVKSDIEDALKRRAINEAQLINVAVNGRNVTLSGSVHSWAERDLAAHSAWSTSGVANVVDNIKVGF